MTGERHAPAALGDPAARFAELARKHYENFPVGSWLVPKAQRVHMHRIYAFARTGDDLADEHCDREGLAALRKALDEHLEGRPAVPLPMLVDLAETVRERDLDPDLLRALLEAFEQDLDVTRYADEEELMAYCRKSADPVGRLVLQVFGHRDPGLLPWSDRICTGLQLVNHLQDMGEDYRERGRIYFPVADLQRHGVEPEVLGGERAPDGLRAVVLDWCDRLSQDFRESWPLMGAVQGRLRWELRAIVRGAVAVLDCIRAVEGDILAHHIRLSKPARLKTVLGGMMSSRMPRSLRP